MSTASHRFHHKLRRNTEVVGYVLLFKTPSFQIGQVPITRMGGIYNTFGLGVLPSLAAVTEACADAVRCAFFDRNLHSRMPLVNVPTPARLKLLASSEQACDQWYSSRMFTPLTGWHCEFRPNAEGAACWVRGQRGTTSKGTPSSSRRRWRWRWDGGYWGKLWAE